VSVGFYDLMRQDVFDSRDVIKLYEETAEATGVKTVTSWCNSEPQENMFDTVDAYMDAKDKWEAEEPTVDDDYDEDDWQEIEDLRAFVSDCEPYCDDWQYGATIIADRYFVEYAQELAEDCCDMKSAQSWPFNCIDWNEAAEELKQDYSCVECGGRTYWLR
jgi:hypothetical protein